MRVAYVRVSLAGVSDEALTDLDGHFRFTLLLAGTYSVTVKTPDYESHFKEDVRVEVGRVTEVELTLTPPARPYVAPPSPIPTETRTGTVQGTVVSDDGRGLQYANVIVIGAQTGAQTDSEGRFLIRRVPIGTYTVRVRMVGFATEDRKGMHVGEGDTTTVDFRLRAQEVKMKY